MNLYEKSEFGIFRVNYGIWGQWVVHIPRLTLSVRIERV